MDEKLTRTLLPLSIAPLLAVCFFTGGAASPFRFAYILLMLLLSIRLPPKTIFLTGTAFTCGYAVMVIVNKPADKHTMALAVAEFFFYLLTAGAAASVCKKRYARTKSVPACRNCFSGPQQRAEQQNYESADNSGYIISGSCQVAEC